MKKLLLSAAIAVLGLSQVSAQDAPAFGFAEGDLFVEGSVGFNSSNDKNDKEKTSGFNFSPKVGYFLQDGLAVGIQLGVGSSKFEDSFGSPTFESKTNSFSVGAFGRYYFLDLGQRFKTYTEFGAGIGSSGFDDGNDATEDPDTNTFNLGLGLGLNYFVTENIALTFDLTNIFGYQSSKVDVDGAEAVSGFNFGVGSVNNPFGGTANFGILVKL